MMKNIRNYFVLNVLSDYDAVVFSTTTIKYTATRMIGSYGTSRSCIEMRNPLLVVLIISRAPNSLYFTKLLE